MKTEEDDEFDRVKRENAMYEVQRLGQEIEGQPYHFEAYVSPSQRNQVLEEVAKEFDKMKFGDTSQSFATFVRDMKSCPPCHGNCYQGRTCPERNKCLVSIGSPQRTWVGLTDKEIWEWFRDNTALTNESGIRIVRAIEAKLKEKNFRSELLSHG